MKSYDYRLIVGFQETNLTGNVYFSNHILWQGKCREMFIRDYAPEVLKEIEAGLSLITTYCSCEYFSEIQVFNEIIVRMSLKDFGQSSIHMEFEYWRVADGKETMVALGEQKIVCMMRKEAGLTPAPIPSRLQTALTDFA